MTQFSVNTHRFDPYKNFKFRVKWDGRYVAGLSKMSALKRSTQVITHREGGDSNKACCKKYNNRQINHRIMHGKPL